MSEPPRLPPIPAPVRPWRRVGLTLAVAFGVMLLITGITAAVLRPRSIPKPPKPSEATDGERWTHAELIDYLHRCGVQFEARESEFAAFYGPSMLFVPPPDPDDEPADPELAALIRQRDELDVSFGQQPQTIGMREALASVHVVRMASTDQARGKAAVRSGRSFSWGRFIFDGGSKLRGEIRTELCREP